MNITILTFQFAHNYGALLQAYALKNFISNNITSTTIVPYYPEWAQTEYAITPFKKNIPFKRRIRLAFQYQKRKELSLIFNTFIENELNIKQNFNNHSELIDWIDKNDYVVCGSDQIWNNLITKNDFAYFAANTKAKKISYAASTGTKALTDIQKEYVLKYLPDFGAISVREPNSAKQIQEIYETKITVVLDPVFLLSKLEWESIASPMKIKKPYLFLYFLEENEDLLIYAKNYAKRNNLVIYDVHPTMANHHKGCQRLDFVGPKEFIWLIKNASCICTNSFHATAFSVIFEKKLLHIPNSKSPERTKSLLERLGYNIFNSNSLPLYDLKKADKKTLNNEIAKSKIFLIEALGENICQ